jgi:hypothetical protein
LDANPGTNGIKCQAANAPPTPAITLTSKLSATNKRMTLVREAPIANRNAISRRRPLKRTSNRLATLLHAISKTKLTAAKSVAKPARKFRVTSSDKIRSVVTNSLSMLFGYWAR